MAVLTRGLSELFEVAGLSPMRSCDTSVAVWYRSAPACGTTWMPAGELGGAMAAGPPMT